MDWTAWAMGIAGALLGVAASWLWQWRRPKATNDDQQALAVVTANLPVGVLLFSEQGQIRYANPWACKLLFQGQSAKGHNFLALLAAAPAPVARALTGSKDALVNVEYEGEQHSFQLLRRNVTFQQEPHSLLLLNPLTRELDRREIDLLKKVIRVISHELNNSLASMSSLISSGRYIVEHPEQLQNLRQVFDGFEERTHHLTHFLSEYAQLSKLPVARPKQVPWRPLLDRLQQLYPTVQVGPPPSEMAWFDEVQVEQALINLLKNALESGGAETKVRLLTRTVDEQLEIAVLDRGAGFSQEALEQGLLPFYSTKEHGSGVGLALCREVAAGHGGALKIKTRAGGGSAVCLRLPREAAESVQDGQLALTLTRT